MPEPEPLNKAQRLARRALLERLLPILNSRMMSWAPELVGIESESEARAKLLELVERDALPALDQVNREILAELLASSHGGEWVRPDVLDGFAERKAREDAEEDESST